MIQQFGDHICKEIRKDLNDLADMLASGGAKSYEDYTHITGVIKGLAQAERLVLDLIEAANKSEE